jgi:DNA-binding transcriptional regulator YbjK
MQVTSSGVEPSRRSQLADAAIATLAREGSRGLTHRAVDRAAGVPEGSTSFYFRSRLDLLRATVGRLAELDAAEIPAIPETSAKDFAVAFTAVVAHLLTDGRERQLGRYQLLFEAARQPELRETLVASAGRIRALVAERFAALGVPEPEDRARDFLTLIDGLLFNQLVGPDGRTLDGPALQRLITRILAAVGVQQPTPCGPQLISR